MLVAAVGFAGVAPGARADAPTAPIEVPPYVPPDQPVAGEPPASGEGASALQGLSAFAIPVLGFLLASQAGDMAGVVVVATPLVTGAAICGFGALNRTHQSSCPMTMVATAGGALLTLPLLYLGLILDLGRGGGLSLDGDGGGSPVFALILGGLGWFVAQPVAGLATWHGAKWVRPQSVAPPPRPSARGSSRVPGQVTTTLLAFSF